MLKLGAKLNSQDDCGRTALFVAVEWSHVAVVDALIEKGANVDLRRDTGTSPLMVAAAKGSVDIVRLLVKAHANIRFRDCHRRTAWIQARHSGNDRKLRELLDPSLSRDEV